VKTQHTPLPIFLLALLAVAFAQRTDAGGSVPVGTYLYANPENIERFKGSLTLKFQSPAKRLVVAYGRRYRKIRKSRKGTSEAERQLFKPFQAKVIDEGRKAIFWHLPPDIYDVVVVEDAGDTMKLYEGVALLRGSKPELATDEYFEEIKATLSPRTDRIGGWEGFFDTKQFERYETDGSQGCVLVQQMRLGKAFAESGDVLKGCIHSIDICWLERARVEGVGWQVMNRQQLYRDELPARTFFKHAFMPELQGHRIGTRAKEVTIDLP